MDRLACVSLPAFPLQILLRQHLEWRGAPVVVVEEDRPQSPVLWVNEPARRAGVLPGARYAAALTLAPTLRAGIVSAAQAAAEQDRVTARLRRWSPDVEPSTEQPGVFWLCCAGLDALYPNPARWAEAIRSDLREAGLDAAVVVGFTRFDTYAVAQVTRGVRVFDDPAQARLAALDVPLARLAIAPEIREDLRKLGVSTAGAFLRLPAAGVRERFGPEAFGLHRTAAGALWAPLRPADPRDPVVRAAVFDAPETDVTRCMFALKPLLDPMLAALAARGETLAALELRINLDRRGWRTEEIRPAAPTLDAVQILDLVRLRLEAARLPAGITDVSLTARAAPGAHEQLRFFTVLPRRDLAAGNRALARLRADLGEHAVVRAQIRDGHLPEARMVWEPVAALTPPRPRAASRRTLVRRIFTPPLLLPPASRHQSNDGWLILGTAHGSVVEMFGPYVVSGGWWVREVDRAYHFARTRRGDLLWLYDDRRRRRWFLHGRVE